MRGGHQRHHALLGVAARLRLPDQILVQQAKPFASQRQNPVVEGFKPRRVV